MVIPSGETVAILSSGCSSTMSDSSTQLDGLKEKGSTPSLDSKASASEQVKTKELKEQPSTKPNDQLKTAPEKSVGSEKLGVPEPLKTKEPPQSELQKTRGDSKKEQEEEKPDGEETKVWQSKWQLILTAIGMAIGLENIWRFPTLASAYGGSAFLIPYMTCCMLIAFPMLYAEFLIGQFSRANAAFAFHRYAPAFQGLGMACVGINVFMFIFYSMVVTWAGLYLALAVGGQSYKWTECDNWWNTANCISPELNRKCRAANETLPYGTHSGLCTDAMPADTAMSGAREFFEFFLKRASSGIGNFGHLNWPIVGCLLFLNILTVVTSIWGLKILGWISYVTIPLPYLIIFILFIRSLFLDGAWDGIHAFLFQPDMSKLLSFQTWKDALNQSFFSFAVGYGVSCLPQQDGEQLLPRRPHHRLVRHRPESDRRSDGLRHFGISGPRQRKGLQHHDDRRRLRTGLHHLT